jgi:hypothetical protein
MTKFRFLCELSASFRLSSVDSLSLCFAVVEIVFCRKSVDGKPGTRSLCRG